MIKTKTKSNLEHNTTKQTLTKNNKTNKKQQNIKVPPKQIKQKKKK